MCGRFTLRTPLTVLAQQFLFDLGGLPLDAVAPRFNIAPTQQVLAVRQLERSGPRQAARMHWGLIPNWAKDPKMAASMINARCETLAEKPSFRAAFTRRRCLVLADGFYEWKKEGRQKIPHYFQLADGRPFAFAAVWETWRGPAPAESDAAAPKVESCAIVTTTANEICSPYHERMPVILPPAAYDIWLNPDLASPPQLLPLLTPLPADQMRSRVVSTRVNNVRNDDVGVLQAETALFE